MSKPSKPSPYASRDRAPRDDKSPRKERSEKSRSGASSSRSDSPWQGSRPKATAPRDSARGGDTTRERDAVRGRDAGRGDDLRGGRNVESRHKPAGKTTERDRPVANKTARKPERAGARQQGEPGREKPARPPQREPQPWVDENSEPAGVERKIYGLNAALAFVRDRGDDIIRGYFVEAVARKHFSKLMKELAQTRRAYHIVEAEEMQKVTESTHHEGVCLLVRDTPVQRLGEWLQQAPATAHTVLALEGVANPHNLGAIMRTAAHFGVAALVVSGAERLRSGAAMRTAEGGAERIPLLEAAGFQDGLIQLQRAGYSIMVTSSHKGVSVFDTEWPAKVCVVMGEEQQGVSRPVVALADQCVSIPGTGAVESLNVSVATAIIVASCTHAQQQQRRTAGTLRKAKTPARKPA